MLQKKIKITHPRGIHLKPTTMIVQYCLKHQEIGVELQKDGITARGDSVMSLLSLNLTKGSTVTIVINKDRPEILKYITDILTGKME